MLSCALNCSEGRDQHVIEVLARAAGEALLDLHADPFHHRCVLTLGGQLTVEAARRVTTAALGSIDLRRHTGVHPRLGVVDVVPFTPYPPYVRGATAGTGGATGTDTTGTDTTGTGGGTDNGATAGFGGGTDNGATAGFGGGTASALTVGDLDGREALADSPLDEALAARDAFARWACSEHGLPCFLYGPQRSLPELRRGAFGSIEPDCGPREPDPARGACCVGARGALVAYNLVLAHNDVAHARRVAAAVRSPALRTLGLAIGDEAQVSCNLLSPLELGPAEAYDLVSALVEVRRAELVGLIPASVLARTPSQRWSELDLGPERTLERRLAQAQADRARTAPISSGRRTSPN